MENIGSSFYNNVHVDMYQPMDSILEAMEGMMSNFIQKNDAKEKAQKYFQMFINTMLELMQIKINMLQGEIRTEMKAMHCKFAGMEEMHSTIFQLVIIEVEASEGATRKKGKKV